MPYPHEPNPRDWEREAEMAAAIQGAFVSLGSTMDCLAGVLVGLAGLKTPLIRADLPKLLSRVDFDQYPEGDKDVKKMLAPEGSALRDQQVTALRSLITSIEQAGPTGWFAWALGMRNMVTHREHRTEIITFQRTKAKGLAMYRLPPADPAMSNMQALRTGGNDILRFNLFEDTQDVLEGLAGSLCAAVIATLEVLRSTWEWRKIHPLQRVNVADQWTAPTVTAGFAGYGKPVPPTVLKNAVAVMNPLDAKRIREANLGGGA
jgi:hypothetical protein